jgi:redox-sensitive bicupin YhaK (pirin superfamily)
MTLALTKSPRPDLARSIAHRIRGRTHGPVTRLMSPSDVGEILKPFVFLDLVDYEGAPFEGSLHPHSGIATVTYIFEGSVSYIDPDNLRGTLSAAGVEWMQAGSGMWHGGGLDKAGRTRGFQLWIALPPALELGPTISIYQPLTMCRVTARRASCLAATGPHRAPSSLRRRSTISPCA